MNFLLWMFLLMLVACFPAFVILLIKKYFDYKREVGTELVRLRKDLQFANVEELQKQVAAHRARIEALEAIVTDKGYDLKDKITSL